MIQKVGSLVTAKLASDAAKIGNNLNSVVDSGSKASGNLNRLGLQLTFPSDLGETDTDSGIIHWVQFTTYSKENGSLTSLLTNVFETAEREQQSLQEIEQKQQDLEDESEEKERKSIETELEGIQQDRNQNILNIGRTSEVTSETRFGRAGESIGDTLQIYLPGNLTFSDSMSYEEASFAGLRGLANTSARDSLTRLNLLRRLGGMVDPAAAIVGQDSLNVGQALSAALGVVVNPRKEQLFQGVSFRSFDFNFNLIPRNRKEVETTANIIKFFRFHAHPELSKNGAFFQFPSEFGIQFKSIDVTNPNLVTSIDNPSLPKLKRCFLEKVSTNYTPDEVYQSFADGKAIRLELSLSFKEAQYITRNDVEAGY